MSDDESDYGSDEGEWLYVEDHYDIADELAEHICPSPVQATREDHLHDYDPYDYFGDISYLSDSYNDGPVNSAKVTAQHVTSSTLGKRKRKGAARKQPSKRQKSNEGAVRTMSDYGTPSTVVWKAATERDDDDSIFIKVATADLSTFALLPEWKDLDLPYTNDDTPAIDATPPSAANKGLQATAEPKVEKTADIPSAGIDVADLTSIAGLLSGEGIEALQELLKSKGLDPEAVQLVLQDMMDGHERTFSDEEEEEENEDEDSGEEPEEAQTSND